MKLAEALVTRADLKSLIAQVRARMTQNAKVQEGEQPAEDVEGLLAAFEGMMGEMELIVKRINRTNASTPFGAGTLSDAIAERDCLRLRITALRDLCGDLAITHDRFIRTEIRFIRCIDPARLQKTSEGLSKAHRELDVKIQAKNWETELAG